MQQQPTAKGEKISLSPMTLPLPLLPNPSPIPLSVNLGICTFSSVRLRVKSMFCVFECVLFSVLICYVCLCISRCMQSVSTLSSLYYDSVYVTSNINVRETREVDEEGAKGREEGRLYKDVKRRMGRKGVNRVRRSGII